MVILITGKRNSGKSHYAKLLKEELENESFNVSWIDGDDFRAETGNKDYTYEGRLKNLTDAASLAAAYENKGFIVLMSFVMPLRKLRNKIRDIVNVSRIVYIPGGDLWQGTNYERPSDNEMRVRNNNVDKPKSFFGWVYAPES